MLISIKGPGLAVGVQVVAPPPEAVAGQLQVRNFSRVPAPPQALQEPQSDQGV